MFTELKGGIFLLNDTEWDHIWLELTITRRLISPAEALVPGLMPPAPTARVSGSDLSRSLAPLGSCPWSRVLLVMPVTLYSDKFRSHDPSASASSAPEYGASPGAGLSAGHGSRSRGLRGWEVIKKAIFTPIGTKDVQTHRRRRSRRNLHDPREQLGDEKINGIQSISSDQELDAAPANNYKRKSNQKFVLFRLANDISLLTCLFIY